AVPLGGLCQGPVPADPDAHHRPGHLHHRGTDVHADLRAGRQPAMSAVIEPIAGADIAQARAAARAARRRTVDVLEESLALDADGFTARLDRKSTRLNSSHLVISYAVFCLKKKKQ